MLTLGKFIPSVEGGRYHSKQWFDVFQTDLEFITLLSQSLRSWPHRQTLLFVFRSYAYRGQGGVETTYIFSTVLSIQDFRGFLKWLGFLGVWGGGGGNQLALKEKWALLTFFFFFLVAESHYLSSAIVHFKPSPTRAVAKNVGQNQCQPLCLLAGGKANWGNLCQSPYRQHILCAPLQFYGLICCLPAQTQLSPSTPQIRMSLYWQTLSAKAKVTHSKVSRIIVANWNSTYNLCH